MDKQQQLKEKRDMLEEVIIGQISNALQIGEEEWHIDLDKYDCNEFTEVPKIVLNAFKTTATFALAEWELYILDRKTKKYIGYLLESLDKGFTWTDRDRNYLELKKLNLEIKACNLSGDLGMDTQRLNELSEEMQNLTKVKRTKEDIIQEVAIELYQKPETLFVTTGIEQLDNMTGGFGQGELIIIAARPGVGKTHFLINLIIENMKKNEKILFNALEMSEKENYFRLLSRNVYDKGIRKTATQLRMEIQAQSISDKLDDSLGEIYDVELEWSEAPTKTDIALFRRECKEMAKKGTKIILVDHMGLFDPKGQQRYPFMTDVSRILKQIALEENIVMIALCQLNRRTSNKSLAPNLGDLRDSGAIEENADKVIFLYPPTEGEEKGKLMMSLDKNRTGLTGVVEVRTELGYSKFF